MWRGKDGGNHAGLYIGGGQTIEAHTDSYKDGRPYPEDKQISVGTFKRESWDFAYRLIK